MKVAAVVQRYGIDIVGGAERLCRGVCEGLAERGHDVEVLTSCAHSYRTWANHFGAGIDRVNGVRTRRFRVDRERDMEAFNRLSAELFADPSDADRQRAWVDAQGPFVPGLIDHLHGVANQFDRLLFFTYLYYPTVHGIHAAPDKSLLVPTAHDEAPIYLEIYDSVFGLPAGLVFNTRAEAAFARRRFPGAPDHQAVIGVGIDGVEGLFKAADGIDDIPAAPHPVAGDPAAPPHLVAGGPATAPHPVAGGPAAPPAAVYAGRIEAGKGVAEMIDFLERFRRHTGSRIRLWLLGEVAMEVPERDWIEVLGFVDDAEKARRLRAATVLLAPSPLESFGIVVLEGMAAGATPLVNAAAEAAVEHCRSANAGLYYRGYEEFAETLTLLLDNPRLRAAMNVKGAGYVRDNYSWPRIVDRYERFLAALPA